ncbi:16S rRNA (guanine(527)-N(7))-methyltransferase RsmG [Erythrobacteraceae bacterium CFH 75059]|uniref:16S rRNA (guanine(527)-N(7))-methyltransferase RsmG n=1 Tax=Qipengyuania thermophila TaxID=2509361 RepID=UPI00101F2AD9|nr:16S rRNA (guanine(527)-N(7))-methyltransferase RsmG [Qipengyuania thermophila]TCD06697.1 16S rRNA (guanine(527)-N(7))-methyltransferase RsmG [Erythrobacteraceae bacterium CFH 75059]
MITSEEAARAFVLSIGGEDGFKRIEAFVEALVAANETQNLVSRHSLDQVWRRHVADSAQLLQYAPDHMETWLDVGTGAGFPGLIVAALRPDMKVTLVEPRRLRVEWLERMCASLSLTRCKILGMRLEAAPATQQDVITARAVASLSRLLEMTQRNCGRTTTLMLPKGAKAEEELSALPKKARRRWVFHVKHSLTCEEGRIIIARPSEGSR